MLRAINGVFLGERNVRVSPVGKEALMGDILWVSKHLMFICKADVSATFLKTKSISLFFSL